MVEVSLHCRLWCYSLIMKEIGGIIVEQIWMQYTD